MAQETTVMMDAVQRRAAALATGRATVPLRNKPGGRVEALYSDPEPDLEEPPDDPEAEESETSDNPEPDPDDPDELPETAQGQGLARQTGQARVAALVQEALRLGEQYGLLTRQPDGTLLLPGQTRSLRREGSDCTCATCSSHNQRHWWCVVCNSGPHDWFSVKPQFERQTLKAGGITGTRQAACTAQCAREYLGMIGRTPTPEQRLPMAQELDPTLGLPG